MAVLHLLLQHNPAVRTSDDLAKVVRQARLGRGQEVPARAVPHDRRPQHGVGHPGRLRRSRHAAPPRRPAAGRLPGRRDLQERRHSTASGSATRSSSSDLNQGNQASRRLGLGQARHGLGRRPVRGRPGGPARQRGPDPPGRRPRAAHLPRLQGDRPGQGRSLRRSRRGPERHQRPRQVARLRRPDPVPRRADPLAGHATRRTWASSRPRGTSWPSWSSPASPTAPCRSSASWPASVTCGN